MTDGTMKDASAYVVRFFKLDPTNGRVHQRGMNDEFVRVDGSGHVLRDELRAAVMVVGTERVDEETRLFASYHRIHSCPAATGEIIAGTLNYCRVVSGPRTGMILLRRHVSEKLEPMGKFFWITDGRKQEGMSDQIHELVKECRTTLDSVDEFGELQDAIQWPMFYGSEGKKNSTVHGTLPVAMSRPEALQLFAVSPAPHEEVPPAVLSRASAELSEVLGPCTSVYSDNAWKLWHTFKRYRGKLMFPTFPLNLQKGTEIFMHTPSTFPEIQVVRLADSEGNSTLSGYAGGVRFNMNQFLGAPENRNAAVGG